jgi:urea transporter
MRTLKSKIREHLSEYFKAVSQAFFFRSAWFGAAVLFLFLCFDFYLFICGLLGSLIGYIYSVRNSTPKVLRDWGLITVNGLFFGIAMASLFQFSVILVVCVVLGALSIPLLTKACFEVLQHWKLSPVVAPYLFTVWTIWLCARGLSLNLKSAAWPDAMANLPSLHPSWNLGMKLTFSAFESMGRLLFLPKPIFGLCILILIAAFSFRKASFFFLGTVFATLIAHSLAGTSSTWEYGYFNYSAGLVGLGLASFPQKFTAPTIFLFCIISCFVTMATEQIFGSFHLPALSIPYVITLWFAQLSRVPRITLNWNTITPIYESPYSTGFTKPVQSKVILLEERAS